MYQEPNENEDGLPYFAAGIGARWLSVFDVRRFGLNPFQEGRFGPSHGVHTDLGTS